MGRRATTAPTRHLTPGISNGGDSTTLLTGSAGTVAPTPLKKASLKPLHWVKVTRAVQGSLWAENQKQEEDIKFVLYPIIFSPWRLIHLG
jgi:hypothetical protein